MRVRLSSFLFLCTVQILNSTNAFPLEDEMKLIKDVIEKRSLFATCDPLSGRRITIHFVFYPLFIIGLDERRQVLTSSGWMDFWWMDSRLTWNASEYGGIDTLRVKREKIWMPDLVAENSVTEFAQLGSHEDFVIVSSDGTVEWSAGNVYRTICEVDVGKFPFDSQICLLNISTLMYYADEMTFVSPQDPVILDFYATNSEWELLNLTGLRNSFQYEKKEIVQDAFSFQFKLKRRSAFYILKIIIPTVVLSVLNSFVFIVPPESGEKVSMSVTTMLSLTVFLSYIGDATPNNSESIPVIALFVVLHLALGALSIIVNIIILDLHYKYERAYPSRETPKTRAEHRISAITGIIRQTEGVPNGDAISGENTEEKTSPMEVFIRMRYIDIFSSSFCPFLLE